MTVETSARQPTVEDFLTLAEFMAGAEGTVTPSGRFRTRIIADVETSVVSMLAAQEIADTSGRRVDTPVRKQFVRSDRAAIPPLSQIYSGGRSGIVAIKLYLALLWRSSAEPYSTDKPARAWATLLDLPDPEGKGARRITSALRTLRDANLIEIESQPGAPNEITLLDERGTRRPYSLPSSSYSLAAARGAKPTRLAKDLYFKVPAKLWTTGLIQALSGPALVMLLILLAEQGGEGKTIWVSPPTFADRYRVSHKTRTLGSKELSKFGLLRIYREALTDNPAGTVYDRVRYRNVYRLAPITQASKRE